jgi:hypothetical protein
VGLCYKDWGIVYTIFKPVYRLIRFILGPNTSTNSNNDRKCNQFFANPLVFRNSKWGTVAQHEKGVLHPHQDDISRIFMPKEDISH